MKKTIIIFFICISYIAYSQSKCECIKYYNSISESWQNDYLGYDGTRNKMYEKITDCDKYLIGKSLDDIYAIFGKPFEFKIKNKEKYLRYHVYNEIDNKYKQALLDLLFVFNKRYKLKRTKLIGIDG